MAELSSIHIPDTVHKIMGPLKFKQDGIDFDNPRDTNLNITCLLCESSFESKNWQESLLEHLFKTHNLIIADVNLIADLPEYFKYWKYRFSDNPIEEFCTTMLLDQKPDGESSKDTKYYLLSDVITEDKTLREELQQKRLERVLGQQTFERNDNSFKRCCWFCHLEYSGSRSGFLSHLSESHNMQLGRPSNLVYTTELLDVIEDKLNRLQCLYCEKTFKDRNLLKEHMRKKLHKRINPDNKNYDKYYMINYLEVGKSWHMIQRERKNTHPSQRNRVKIRTENENLEHCSDDRLNNSDDESDSDWSGWNEEYVTQIFCLFCDHEENSFDILLEHMKNKHGFCFNEFTKDFTFYDKLRLVNYIRREIYLRNCITCHINFDTAENLMKHMSTSKHYQLPDSTKWNQVEYFFPTYEDDSFLCFLEELNDLD